MKKVFIIILTWNRKDLVKKCLDSVSKIKTKHRINTVVVDNASEDASANFIKKNYPNIKLIENKQNLGWSGGNNVGIKYALKRKADYIVLINNDVVLDPRCVDNLIHAMEEDPKIGISSPKIYKYGSKPNVISNAGNYFNENYLGTDRGYGERDLGQYDINDRVDFVAGLICTKSIVFKKVGLLDVNFFLYFEDADFCMRAKKKGFIFLYIPAAVLYHGVSSTIGANSPTHVYYNVRNHLLFIEKYGNPSKLIVQILHYIKQLLRAFYKKEKNAKFMLLGLRDYLFRRFNGRQYW